MQTDPVLTDTHIWLTGLLGGFDEMPQQTLRVEVNPAEIAEHSESNFGNLSYS